MTTFPRAAGLAMSAVVGLVAGLGGVGGPLEGDDGDRGAGASTVVAVSAAAPSPAPAASPGPRDGAAGSSADAVPVGPLPDPYRGEQWYLDRIGLDGVGPVPDGAGQVIAIVDSGVDLAHPDLVDALARDDAGRVMGRDFVDGDDVAQDVFGHGTMVAGVAAARSGNGLGVAGVVGAGARILPVRVLDATGRATASRVARGVDWAVDAGATIVNLSLESAGVGALRDDPALDRAIRAALDAGVVVVVAAGNGDAATDPVDDGRLVVVGATDRSDRRAGFSDRGRTDLVMAPGVEIVSTWCRSDDRADAPCDGATHGYGVADGTSFAAPQVSGLIAMLASTGLTPAAAAARLAATTEDLDEPGPDVATGRGLVSARAALGGWPDHPIPATTPSAPADREPVTAAPDVEPAQVVGVRAPSSGGPGLRLVVVGVILVAVGVLVRGLVAGASARSRAARDEVHE